MSRLPRSMHLKPTVTQFLSVICHMLACVRNRPKYSELPEIFFSAAALKSHSHLFMAHCVWMCNDIFCHWCKICHTDLSWHVSLDFSIWIKAMVENSFIELWFKIVFCWHCAGRFDLILLDFVDVAVANIVSLKKLCNSVIAATTFTPQVKVSNYRGLLG